MLQTLRLFRLLAPDLFVALLTFLHESEFKEIDTLIDYIDKKLLSTC